MIRRLTTIGVALCAAFSLLTPSWADVTIVQEVSVKGAPKIPAFPGAPPAPDMSRPTMVTIYYKGDKQRSETGDSVTLSDLASGKIYTLDAKKKTFVVRSLDKIGSENPFLEMIRMDVTATVTPTDEKKTILNKSAKRYDYAATIKTSMDGVDEQMAAMFPTITISGQQWATEDVVLPIDFKQVAQTTMVRNFPPMMAKGIKDLAEKMSAIKGFPLSSIVTVKFVFAKEPPPQLAARIPKEPMVTTTEVKSIKEGALEDSLFVVPSDYKEVKEAPPSFTPGAPGASQ